MRNRIKTRMNDTTFQVQACQLAELMCKLYSKPDRRPKVTLWDTALCWDGSRIGLHHHNNPYSRFMDALFERIRSHRSLEDLHQPETLMVARTTSPAQHFTILSMANREQVQIVYQEALEARGSRLKDKVLRITSDREVLTEAMDIYSALSEVGSLEGVDALGFLLHYDEVKGEYKEMLDDPIGTYEPVAQRLIYRFADEHIIDGLFSLCDPDTANRARKHHEKAMPPLELKVDEALAGLYADKVQTVVDWKQNLPQLQRIHIPGKKRARKDSTKIYTNWRALMEGANYSRESYRAFLPEEVVMSRLERSYTTKYITIFVENGLEAAKKSMAGEVRRADPKYRNVLAEILGNVKNKLEIMSRFPGYKINHEMPITISGERR